ncbi:MAG: GntR family transcriptional regulator [Bacillota bacterium]
MNFDNGLPIYLQIVEIIKSRIVTGVLKSGEKLPSVRDLATELKVNPNTILRSYGELERQSIVFTQRGMGTFVTEEIKVLEGLKDSMAREKVISFMEDMERLGYTRDEMPDIIRKIALEGK